MCAAIENEVLVVGAHAWGTRHNNIFGKTSRKMLLLSPICLQHIFSPTPIQKFFIGIDHNNQPWVHGMTKILLTCRSNRTSPLHYFPRNAHTNIDGHWAVLDSEQILGDCSLAAPTGQWFPCQRVGMSQVKYWGKYLFKYEIIFHIIP